MVTYRFYSVQRQTILLVKGRPLASERVKLKQYTFLSQYLLIHRRVEIDAKKQYGTR